MRIRSYSGPHFSRIFPHLSLRIQSECGENADQNNFEYGHFLRSVLLCKHLELWTWRKMINDEWFFAANNDLILKVLAILRLLNIKCRRKRKHLIKQAKKWTCYYSSFEKYERRKQNFTVNNYNLKEKCFRCIEAVSQTCSVKNVFREIS